ncbi:MAG: hypothetical protein KJ983_04065 [Candidatus Omnitrophica bacterium]|nr:hypothetical protein [Candidatus Omnitrophota bacterium]
MKKFLVFYMFLCVLILGCCKITNAETVSQLLFSTEKSREEFAVEVTDILGKNWRTWQDNVRIDNIDVEGAQGFLFPGDLGREVLNLSDMMKSFDRTNKSQEYIVCVKAVLGALEYGMRSWQRGYSHKNIPFPRGASCTFTMPPCNNVPIAVESGKSLGDKNMTERDLYSYMLYRVPKNERYARGLLKSSAKAMSECFREWKETCFITGILAFGGIAPQPAPMGTGPGPVRGAKGKNGKLTGPYFNVLLMRERMLGYFDEQ